MNATRPGVLGGVAGWFLGAMLTPHETSDDLTRKAEGSPLGRAFRRFRSQVRRLQAIENHLKRAYHSSRSMTGTPP